MPENAIVVIRRFTRERYDPDDDLTTGVLLSPDTVLVPQPPEELLGEHPRFEVVIASWPLRPGAAVERHRPAGLDLLREAGPATVLLSAPSRFTTWGPVDGCRLRTAFEQHADVWDAVIQAELTPPDTPRVPPPGFSQRLAHAETAAFAVRPRLHDLRDPGQIGNWVCYITPLCEPCRPHLGPR
ncbi:hypothetical protein [Nonomuraea turcica]|uniref:hypothetical protein n=1 Tax=Nonomuraea sp. G32 TaxID=3067274 RepID=UPI00273BB375|nr:hypothetical protein [Nonomuraea sp. G32]MDP4511730.1 hypothetical protein [Nonomuraea sp. G32]